MTSEEMLVSLCGETSVKNFKRVKGVSQGLASAIREMVAEDLEGRLPAKGKQFVTTRYGHYRISTGSNSDNSTEMRAHDTMGAIPVQVFDDIYDRRKAQGVISLDELYRKHGFHLDWDAFMSDLRERL